MTVTLEHSETAAHPHPEGPHGLLKWITSTDHKVIGMTTS